MRTVYTTVSAVVVSLIVLSPSAIEAKHGRPPADNVVLQWNTAALQAIKNTGFAPMWAARGLAILHTCMYDAWAAYDALAVGTRLGALLRQPPHERTHTNKRTAVSYAAYRALVDLFPTQRPTVFDPLMLSLGYDPMDTSSDTGASIGTEACDAVLAFRHHDGANQLGDMNNGAPYSDYTGYQSLNTADNVVDPNRWQTLRNANGTTQVFLAPHWGLVTPFALTSPSQFLAEPPAQFGTFEYERQAREIVHLSASLDDRTKAIALYWADGANTETPPGHWNRIAQFVSRRDAHTLDRDVKMFFVLGNALLDASVAVWDCKRHYDYVRPITAVRFLYSGHFIKAWAGPGRGTRWIRGEAFSSYIPTPPFAEYTSGHSAFSASAAQVLRLFTGSDAYRASVVVAAGSSFTEPGIAPSVDVRLIWRTFDEAADEAGTSRRYGGIHFSDGDHESRRMGRRIGTIVWKRALTFFIGTASIQ